MDWIPNGKPGERGYQLRPGRAFEIDDMDQHLRKQQYGNFP